MTDQEQPKFETDIEGNEDTTESGDEQVEFTPEDVEGGQDIEAENAGESLENQELIPAEVAGYARFYLENSSIRDEVDGEMVKAQQQENAEITNKGAATPTESEIMETVEASEQERGDDKGSETVKKVAALALASALVAGCAGTPGPDPRADYNPSSSYTMEQHERNVTRGQIAAASGLASKDARSGQYNNTYTVRALRVAYDTAYTQAGGRAPSSRRIQEYNNTAGLGYNQSRTTIYNNTQYNPEAPTQYQTPGYNPNEVAFAKGRLNQRHEIGGYKDELKHAKNMKRIKYQNAERYASQSGTQTNRAKIKNEKLGHDYSYDRTKKVYDSAGKVFDGIVDKTTGKVMKELGL